MYYGNVLAYFLFSAAIFYATLCHSLNSSEQEEHGTLGAKKYVNADDKLLQDQQIRVGITDWRGGIYVTGIHYINEVEIKDPLEREIERIFKEKYTETSFKGFVFSGCTFNDSMLGILKTNLVPYRFKYNKKTKVRRTSYFQKCFFQSEDALTCVKMDSAFFSEKIDFQNWEPE